MPDTPLQALRQHFGFEDFRPGQQPIIDALIADQDVLALLPTGGGKSICFQVPALCHSGTTLVISPLISLMIDQVQALEKKGISAAYLSSQQSPTDQEHIKAKAQTGRYKLLYLAPERLVATGVGEWLQSFPISLIILDEAHCISEWGHDFRPSYRTCLQFLNSWSKRPPIGAFTATATPETQADVCQVLQLDQPHIFRSSFKRNNLRIHSVKCPTSTHKLVALGRLLTRHRAQPTIIYCSSRGMTEQLTEFLRKTLYRENPHQVAFYHARIPAETKNLIQSDFLEGKITIMIATTAFGMGVDKPDVRLVTHYHLPPSIENYFQEIGRAGRDGLPSQCYLLSSQADLQLHQPAPTEPTATRRQAKLNAIWDFTTCKACRMQTILKYFGETSQKPCHNCDWCLKLGLKTTHAELKVKTNLSQVVMSWRRRQPQPWQDVLSQRVLTLLSVYQPRTEFELQALPGIGQQLLKLKPSLIHAFSRYYGLSAGQAVHNPA